MDYTIGIVAHVDRAEITAELAAKVSPDVVMVDDGTMGASMNHLRTLQALYERAPDKWLVVLEDDALPVDQFHEQLGMVLKSAPTRIVSLYLGTGYPNQYQKLFVEAMDKYRGICWLEHAHLRHCVGYCIHPDVSLPMLRHMERFVPRRYSPEDAVTWWATRNNEMVAYTNPSIVDHRDGPTVIDYRMVVGFRDAPGRKRPRVAHKVGTRLAWSDNSVTVRPR